MDIERALAWYCNLLFDAHEQLILATVDREGLPQLASVGYRRDGDDLSVTIAADSPVAQALRATGPVAGLLIGRDSIPLVSFSGAAERSDDPASADSAVYRLATDALQPLQRAMESHTFVDGDAIIRQGEIADRYYVILEGECEVSRVGGGAPQSLAQLQAGAAFGESGLLAGAPRNASVYARGPVTLVSLSRNAFSVALHHTGLTAPTLAGAIVAAAQS